MAIDNRLQVFNEEGQSVDYDILASDVKFLPDGKDLPTKLAEMEAHQGDGTVKGVKVGSDTYEPTEGVVDLSTPFSGKVDKVNGKGLSTNDYTDADKTKLQNLPTADQLTQQMGTKANDNAVVKSISVNGTQQSKDSSGNVAISGLATTEQLTSGLSGKQNTLTFDNAPTAGSNNPVKSGGIKTAIDFVTPTIDENGKWVIGGVTTNHDAHGPMGNITIEDANDMVALIVNDLTTGGQANFLSAEMGKALLSVLLQIFGNLGEYAFPNGKPTLNFNTQVSFHVTYSQNDLHVTYADGQGNTAPSTVDLLGRLEIQLGTNDDLYVINESAVKVFVGGTEVSGAYDPTTDKVIIPEVYGNVVIVAEAWTYVDRGLVMHLDGRNRGGTAGKWKSLVDYNSSPLYFKLENCDEQSDYVAGNGTNSKGTAFSNSALTTAVTLLDVGAADGTIEAAYSHAEIASNGNLPIMHNALGSGNRISLTSWHVSIENQDSENTLTMCTAQGTGERLAGISKVYSKSIINTGGYISLKQSSFMFNGNTVATAGTTNQTTTEESKLSIFYRRTSNDQYAKFRLYALRVYSVQLTDAERAQNLAIDQKRFNLS